MLARKDAAAQGLKRFFTNQPCRNGHLAERSVRSGDCVECRKEGNRRRNQQWGSYQPRQGEYYALYRERHREKMRKYMREYMRKYRKPKTLRRLAKPVQRKLVQQPVAKVLGPYDLLRLDKTLGELGRMSTALGGSV